MKRIIALLALIMPFVITFAAEPANVIAEIETNGFFATPVGDAIVPSVIILLCYVLFRLIKGEAREDAELAASDRA